MKHTPGPWLWVNSKTDEPFDFYSDWDGEGLPSLRTLAERKKSEESHWELPDWILDAEPMQHGNDAANARLIAAAPELLEALNDALHVLENEGVTYWTDVQDKARAAIKKAEGEA